MTDVERWTFGEEPLPETVELAGVVRDLLDTVLALEAPTDELRSLAGELRAVQQRLAVHAAPDPWPRVGDDRRPDQRLYLDHSRDVGDYNPCFPRYEMEVHESGAEGTVTFPVVYEGPPAIVHGGMLALFFDCAFQQINCDLGAAGKTRSLAIRYRRPAPILTELQFRAERTTLDGRIESTGELLLGGELLCAAEMSAVLGERANLPAVSPRRPS